MKVVILCGGRGTRLSAHDAAVPKALIEIGGRPLLWHLLKLYSHQGLNDFVLCLGYLGDDIRQYFESLPKSDCEDWKIAFAETGLDTNTGGRIKMASDYLGNDELFCATYGDGLADIDLLKLIEFHRGHGRAATLTAVHPQTHFGFLKLDTSNAVTEFEEKPTLRDWINGGFFVFQRRALDYLEDDSILEREPFQRMAAERQLMAYSHTGFWKCMDTYKDNLEFNQLWSAGKPPWKIWQT
jgi:glucose-1-phosphate cytidylyltransferase